MYRIVLSFCFCFVYAFAISQTAGFTYQSINGSFCSPDTIRFTQTSTGNPIGYIWDFGNGRNSHSANPSVIYSGAGSYTVKLLVIYPQATSQATQVIMVNPTISPAFSISTKDICTPGAINFSATGTTNVESYSWNFGDGTPLISDTTNNIAHTYTNYGNFNVTLEVKSTAGCTSSSQQTVTVQKPAITATVSAMQGCIPISINFNATVSLLPNDAVSSYMWNYGDGSPATTTATANTSHNYTATGGYTPTLSITTTGGCSNTYNFDSIYFGIPPTNLIAYTQKSIFCGSETAVFVGNATNANSYTWDNSETIDIETDTLSKHKYKTLGTKKILVTPSFNGCEGKADSFNIDVIGVISNFSFRNNCSNKKTFSFLNRSPGNLSSIAWDLGDGSPQQNSQNVTHTYANAGAYEVSLTVFDNNTGCSETLWQTVSIADPVLVNPDQFVCRNSITTFKVLNTYDSLSSRYLWYVIGKTPGSGLNNVLNIKADQNGSFDPVDNIVIINNGSSYCFDTVQLNHKIVVKGPVANFISKDSICLSVPLDVTDNSMPYIPGENISIWDWNFGDGSARDSTSKPAPHEYSNPGNYTVSLSVSDINGCTDVYKKTIIVSDDAFVYTVPKSDSLCAGQSKTLIAYQNDSLLWSPANLVSCATCDTIVVNPTQNTTFYATSTNAYGCTARDSVLIKVYLPFTATTPVSNLYICLNDSVQLDVSPPGYKIMWSPPGGLSDPNIYRPVATPSASTTYTATLSDSVGCFTSSVDVNVHLKAQPIVDAGPDQFFPYNSAFTISPVYSNNVVSYLWSPSNQLNCTSCASPSGTILQKQTYAIQVTSDSGCVSKDSVTIFVECKDSNLLLPNAFTPNNDNLNDVFYPFGRGIQIIKNFSIYNREGHLVFQKKNFLPNDKTFGWDGSFKGARYSTAIFVYVLEAICDSGETLSKKGTVTLIR